jgi:chitin synthase
LCPSAGSNSAYSSVNNGVRIPVYYNNMRVFGQIYPTDTLKSFFATKGMNLTNDYENTDLAPIFNGDVNNDCGRFNLAQQNCALVNPYGGGMTTNDRTCLSLAELQRYAKSSGILGYDWADLNKNSITGRGLTLVGDSGK